MRPLSAIDHLAVPIAVLGALVLGALGAAPALVPPLTAVFVIAVVVTLRGRGTLRRRLRVAPFDLCARALSACSLAATLAIAAGALLGVANPASRVWSLWLLTSGTLCAGRLAATLVERRARQRGKLMTPTLVVGAGVVGAQLARRLEQQPELGLLPVGFLDADPIPKPIDRPIHVPVLGAPGDVLDVARAIGARHVIVAFSSARDQQMADVVSSCQRAGIVVSVVPRLFESVTERITLDHIGGMPLLGLRPVNLRGSGFALKYALDRVFALAALVALAPLLLAIALAVRLTSSSSVIFRQRRVGLDGREFELLKFRTMRVDEPGPGFSPLIGVAPGGVEGADRRTRVGRWLRNTSLDELPQLINVLRGEMSLVGPRPERPEFVARYEREIHRYGDRHRVKSGITGWAQVNGLRGQTSIADRIEWDNHYIENWSWRLELRTLALTIAAVVRFREERPTPASAASASARRDVLSGVEAGSSEFPVPAQISDSSGRVQVSESSGRLQVSGSVAAGPKPQLQVVGATPASDAGTGHWFCGYCGSAPAGGAPAPAARVCQRCGEGLLLEASAQVAPGSDDAFLVIDSRLTVQGLSQRAEQFLGVTELEATDRPIAEMLVGADADGDTVESFATALALAASGREEVWGGFVRPSGTFGVRLRARITHCGPPRAALVVLDTPATEPRLRLVESDGVVADQASSTGS